MLIRAEILSRWAPFGVHIILIVLSFQPPILRYSFTTPLPRPNDWMAFVKA